MIVYHGSHIDKFIPEQTLKSRYGIPVLFFTDNRRLADMYKTEKGKVYQAEVIPDIIVDFKRELSYSTRFRNLIHKLYQENHGVVLIKNVYDRPNSNFQLEKAYIMVVFDFFKILNLKPCI